MAEIKLKYDARNNIAKKTVEFILSLGIFEVEESKPALGKPKTKKSPYNPKFVNKVLKSANSKKRIRVDNVNEYLGL